VVLRLIAEQIDGIEIVPGIDAVLVDALRHSIEQLCRAWMRLARRTMREQRQRHTPDTLARDTPVRTIGDHVADPALAPRGHPLHLADLAQRSFAQASLFHADEPLRSRAEDDRRLVAPAMRIAVLERFLVQQRAMLLQHSDHMLVRFEHVLACEQRRAFNEATVAADWIVDLELVLHANGVVFLAVPGRGVHQARARIQRDVIAEHDRNSALVERMSELQTLECLATHFAESLELGGAGALEYSRREFL